jgi:hypothetical protein
MRVPRTSVVELALPVAVVAPQGDRAGSPLGVRQSCALAQAESSVVLSPRNDSGFASSSDGGAG